MDIRLEKQDGTGINLEDIGIIVQDIDISSIEVMGYSENIQGRPGTVDIGADYGTRTIRVPFIMQSEDWKNYTILRDKLFAILTSLEPFYLIERRREIYQTGENVTLTNKRYLVRCSQKFNFDQQFLYGFTELIFETTQLPFAESPKKTMNLSVEEIGEEAVYTHNTAEFRIYNDGNVRVDPRYCEIGIKIQAECDSFFELTNHSTDDTWRYEGALTTNDIVQLAGVRYTKNNLNIFRNTNRRLITLLPGWNEFMVTGASSIQEITFDFRFYYA
ncbi:phage tail domain-containing protein [Priestia endophytica]|uniref:phage tail domain-containing protein n=1 Tax=Priestia endophytica TaxID=135735 RepID=UPI000DCA83B6|nr:phage tail domain-containing protein [Priestia endophytica]RAS74437.1 hypothetical protein A4R27_24140 [Priestia endophytica]